MGEMCAEFPVWLLKSYVWEEEEGVGCFTGAWSPLLQQFFWHWWDKGAAKAGSAEAGQAGRKELSNLEGWA